MSYKMRLFLGTLGFLLVLWFVWNSFSKKENASTKEKAPAVFQVQVITPKYEEFSPFYVFNGVTEPSLSVELSPKNDGIVEKILVPKGRLVDAGTPLVLLSNELAEEKLIEAEAGYKRAKLAYEGNKKLLEKKYISELYLKKAYEELKKAEYSLHQAKKKRSERKVYAPFKGMISEYHVDVGDAMNYKGGKQAVIGTFIQLDPLEIVVQANQQQVPFLKEGQVAEVIFQDGTISKTTISYVKPEPEKGMQTFSVNVFIDNKAETLKAGLSVKVKIYLERKDASQIPMSALIYDDLGQLGVKVVDSESTVQFRPVSILKSENGLGWVSGLPKGAQLIVQGHSFVKTGEKVEPVNMKEAV